MGGEEITKKYRKKLNETLETAFKIYKESNSKKMELFRTKTKANNLIAKAESLEYYKKQMDDLLTENKFLNINHFNFQHKKHRNEAISMFASKKIEGDGSFWRCKQDLYETIKNMYPLYKQRNEDNKKFSEETDEKDCIKMLNEVKEVYSKGMEDKLYGRKYINHDFDQLHSELFREAKLKVILKQISI